MLPVHPAIENLISKEALEAFQNLVTNPKTEITDELIQQIQGLIKVAGEAFGEDNFIEPLNYLAATRRGLRHEDMVALLGSDWNKEEFLSKITCFGFPLVASMENVMFIPSPQLRGMIFSMLDAKNQQSFQKDIAFHLLRLPVQDPVRNSEVLFHLLQAGQIAEACAFFGKSQDAVLNAGADLIGSCFVSGEAGEKIIEAMLANEGEDRFDLYRRFINEVFVSLVQNTAPENSEKFMGLIEQALMKVMGERNTIDNIQLLALTGLRQASIKLRKQELEEVKRYFDNSIGLIDRLLAQNPPIDAFRWENCDAIFNMGMICMDMQQPKAAEHCFDIAFDIIDDKMKQEPEDSDRKLYAASWYVTICRVFQQIQNKEAGKKYFTRGKQVLQQALKLKATFASQNPSILAAQHDLMVMYNDFGDLCHENDLREEAEAAYENALIISERLAAAHPESVEIGILPTITFDRLGKMYMDLNDMKKAEEYFQKSLDLRAELVKKYPNDFRLLHDLASANNNMASLYGNAEDKTPAEKYLLGQLNALRKVNEMQPNNELAVINLLDAILSLGDFYYIHENWQQALETYEEALKVIQPLLGHQVSEHLLNRIAGIHYKAGMAQIKLNAEAQGRQNITVAAQLWKQMSEATKNPLYQSQLDKANEMLKDFN